LAISLSLSLWIKSQPNVKATEKGAKAPGTGTRPAGGNSEGFSRAATQPIARSVDGGATALDLRIVYAVVTVPAFKRSVRACRLQFAR
jgi:hypothetical protein